MLLATNNFITYVKKGDGDTARLERPIYLYAMFCIVAFARWFFSKKQLSFFPLVMTMPLIWVQLTLRGIIRGHDSPQQLLEQEQIYRVAVCFSFAANYNSFKVTFWVFPIIHLVFYWLQMQLQMRKYYNPYDGIEMTEDQKAQFFRQKVTGLVTELILYTAHHYATQFDLLTYVIKGNFISRQQTQLKTFLLDSVDPIMVLLAESGEILLINPAADKIFERHNLEESVANVKLFTVLKEEKQE